MAEPVRARRLTDQEGQRLQQIVRRGKHGSVRVRRAMIIMASASGTLVPAIARLVAADEDTVRDGCSSSWATWRRTRPPRSGAGPGARTPGCASRPANASRANPIEAQSAPVRTLVMGGSDHRNHPALARKLQACLRWRNAHARHPGVLAAQRRERARIRSGRTVNLPDLSRAPQVKVFANQRDLIAIATRVAGTLFHPKIVLCGTDTPVRRL